MKFHAQNKSLENIASYTSLRDLLRNPAYGVLIDTLPDGFVVVDRQGLVVCMNSAAESIADLDREEVIGHTLDLMVRKSALDLELLLHSFKENVPIKTIEGTQGGSEILINTKITRDQNRDFAFQVTTFRDLEILRNQSEKIQGRQKQFKSLADRQKAPEGSQNNLVLRQNGRRIIEKGLRAISMKSRVLLTGESGVGKTETARHLHSNSLGVDKPFIHVNCSSIPETLFESELFGYERGAFTGAHQRGKKGLIEAANGGTLFLDEIGEVPLSSQPKLLQFLEDSTIQRLGATSLKHVNVNLIAATNRDLAKMVAEGSFRTDLYYRINVINLEIPPLRQTRDIIPDLIHLFLAKLSKRRGAPLALSPDCEKFLVNYGFPGNIRELQNILEQLAVECDGIAEVSHLSAHLKSGISEGSALTGQEGGQISAATVGIKAGQSLKEAVRQYETGVILKAIEQHGSKRKAALALGVDIATIVRKTKA